MNVILLISVMALGLSALTEANLPRIDPCDAFAHPALVLVRSSAQTSCPGSMCAGGCCLFVNGTGAHVLLRYHALPRGGRALCAHSSCVRKDGSEVFEAV